MFFGVLKRKSGAWENYLEFRKNYLELKNIIWSSKKII